MGGTEAELIEQLDVGTHTLFVGRVVAAEITGDGEPLTYAYYHRVKKGRAPATAPTALVKDTTGKVDA